MSDEQSNKPDPSFYLIAGAAFLWNIAGIMAFRSQVTLTAEDLATLPELQRVFLETMPAWVTTAFGIAVIGGALGSLLLLLRKAVAILVLAASLAGVLTQNFYGFFISNAAEAYGPGGTAMPVSVIVVSIYLVWFSLDAKKKGWLS